MADWVIFSTNVFSSGFGEIRPPFRAYLCGLNICQCHSGSSWFIYDKKETGENFMNEPKEEEAGNGSGLHIILSVYNTLCHNTLCI